MIGSNSLPRTPGSGTVIGAELLTAIRPVEPGQALRSVPGLFIRDEEGFGLRPNVGVRGLNPTRSSKVLLLEDGVPFTIAPYGDNATYYHPPIERFDRIEVLKGSGQIRYGPQTIGAVVNYLTPQLSGRSRAHLTATTGSRDYLNLAGRGEAAIGSGALAVDLLRKQGSGARENVGSRLTDLGVKLALPISHDQTVTWRASYYAERSRTTYSGLTESEFATGPRQNPFRNDSMLLDRWATSIAHQVVLTDRLSVTTTGYGYLVSRDWWRQSSNSGQRPNDASDPKCGGMANLSTDCGNEGRLRDYAVWGVEPRLKFQYQLGSVPVLADLGFRIHGERQDRRQVNGDSPNAREGNPIVGVNAGIKEDNFRANLAYSAFLQQRFQIGRLGLTPGLRAEHVRFRRTNRLATNAPTGDAGLTTIIPGFGFTWLPIDPLTVFAGVHRGFSPPRTEDRIDNAGQTVELAAEQSWNYEIGLRGSLGGGGTIEATFFRLDFSNQIIPASLAGGAGAALTNAGATRHAGLELAATLDLDRRSPRVPAEVRLAYTYLPTARYEGDRYAYLGTTERDGIGKVFAGPDAAGSRARIRVTDNRLPYAPVHVFSAAIAAAPRAGSRLRLEVVGNTMMFGDAANTAIRSADGQQGPIAGHAIWNATVTQRVARFDADLLLSARNLFDRIYVVDRTRGILPGMPRTISVGASRDF